MSDARRVVLVGAGHAHLHVAARAGELATAGAQVTLIDPGIFWYSGRATAMLGGLFDAGAGTIDPRTVIEAAGGEFIRARVTGIDRAACRLQLDTGAWLDYDRVSFNVGSTVATPASIDCNAAAVWPVKPIAGLWPLRGDLEAQLNAGATPAIAVVGGGATGCETAANLAALARRCRARATVHLIHAEARLAPSLPAGAGRRLRTLLAAHGVDIHTGCRVTGFDGAQLTLDAGGRIDAQIVVLATGLRAPGWLARLDLPFDDGLAVDATLCSTADARVFAAGDCAAIAGYQLPRLGVFGVRQAPILLANLRASLTGATLQPYRPQSRWLSILELGDGTGLAARGAFWWHGRASRWLKHRLDRQFLAQYRPPAASRTD